MLARMTNLIAVKPGYRHTSKRATPGPLLNAGSSRLKWYDVARHDAPVPPGIRQAARDYLVTEADQGTLELNRDIGFAILHRCGASNDFYFLPICTWRNSNELWESVYYKDAAMSAFAPFIQTGRHKGTLCVWELGPVIHEPKAWLRYLQSARRHSDLDEYVASNFDGEVG